MKPLLTQVFASAARARLLQLLVIFHDEPLRFRDMQRRLGVGSRSLQRELSLLTELGLVIKEGRGGAVRYRAQTDTPLWLAVWRLVAELAEPAEVVALILSDLDGIEAAFIFGSTARGDARTDSDVDLFVAGTDVDEIELARRTSEVSALLGRPLSIGLYSPKEVRRMADQENPFMTRVLRQPKVWLKGDGSSWMPTA